MIYLKYQPSAALQPYVMCYYVWENQQQLVAPLEIHSPPNGLGGMVFNYGDPYQVSNEKGSWESVPNCFVAGQFTKNYTLRLSGKLGMVGVAFWPAGLTHLLGIPMIAFTGLRTDLNLVLRREAVQLEHQILESNTNQQRIAVLEQFLLHKLYNANHTLDVVDGALATIIQHKGILSISQLSDELCISPRQFRRRFSEKIGVSPKLFSRIKRFNYVSHLSTTSSGIWMDLVHEGGYYNQAHFIRDFCDFSGKKPSEFVNYNRALAALVGA
ncbi:AraC family transcriptional regulator [Pontibacter diazotrophicus]|uniref:AraC family transcriptional regulator n=1 Tax=Pontibacter diazotrophicus TaxID=1400979 RepID=A0A3D8L700_9BACT|nr:AraC family transcriptional regulator [Pontibacter diazotrophicus]RDV13190.1 AraC family transcriptional regulator [Pontibacter diazotrophicus]